MLEVEDVEETELEREVVVEVGAERREQVCTGEERAKV